MSTLAIGIYTALIGMAGIFLVVSILSLATKLVDLVVGSLEKKRANKKKPIAQPVEIQPAAVVEEAPAVESGISPAKVAAIMAAVSAASGRSVRELKFNSITRAPGANTAWAASGMMDIINARQQYL